MPIGLVIVIVGCLVVFILGSGLYIGLGLAGAGIVAIEFLAHAGWSAAPTIYHSLDSYVLAAIPLFMFMGEIVLNCGLGTRLYNGVSRWTRVIPGGIIHSNVVSCAIFSAISGSSLATAATIGTIAYPEQRKRGYDPALITGSLAAGGTLGILIPPSINMIVYGAFVGASIGRLFMGGYIPGITLALLFSMIVFFRSVVDPSLGPPRERVVIWTYLRDAVISIKDIWPMALLIFIIMGGIYGGIFTPTEAAAVSAFVALVIGAIFRKLNLSILKQSAISALQTTGMCCLLIMGARLLGNAVSMLRIPRELCELVATAELSPYVFWFLVIFVFFILGCFIDGMSVMLLSLPVVYPVLVNTLGFNPILVGIMMVIQAECALITPPVGLNLFIIHGIAKDIPLTTVIRGAWPFVLCQLALIVLITYFPQMVLWLPERMMGP